MSTSPRLSHCPPRASRWPKALLVLALSSVLLGICPEATRAFADESGPGFQVIIHPSNPASRATRRFLTTLFLKEVTRWDDGESARPVDLKGDVPTRRHFSESVLNRSVAAVRNYWQQRIFSGRGVPPPELESDHAVITYVTAHRGAVGYVSLGAELGKAKPIRVE